jgi:hypothetical protein
MPREPLSLSEDLRIPPELTGRKSVRKKAAGNWQGRPSDCIIDAYGSDSGDGNEQTARKF